MTTAKRSSRPDTATLIDEEIELQILGYGHRFSEHHEVVFQAAQSKIEGVSQRTFTSAGATDRAVPDIELQSLSLLYKPQLPLGSATFYGLVGFTKSTIAPDGAEKERKTDFSLGLGWSFRVLSSLELQVEYLRFFRGGNDDDDEGEALGVDRQGSLKPSHALNSLNFGIVFKF